MGLVVVSMALPIAASATTATAKTLLTAATTKARKERKNVMVIFHASWCGWCKKMDAMLESPQFKTMFEKSYVITHVDVLENEGPNKALENDGGAELMKTLGAMPDSGIPFFAILSPDGVKLGDSLLPGKQNMGFPAEPQEVVAFMALLKKTAPRMTETDRTTVETFLKNQKINATGH